MDELVRCPACRGAKKVCKLGGMVGDCNTCKGKGEVKLSEKPIMVMSPIPEPVAEVVKAVSEAVAVSPEPVTQELPLRQKLPDGKVNIYKRKGG